jgi:hypothetical protein
MRQRPEKRFQSASHLLALVKREEEEQGNRNNSLDIC